MLPLIPLVAWGAVAVAGAFSAKKAYDTYSDSKEANQLQDEAAGLYNASASSLNEANTKAQSLFEDLGKLQTKIIAENLTRYEKLIERLITNDSKGLENIVGVQNFKVLQDMKQSIASLIATLSGLGVGFTAGAMAGFGAFGAAGLFASASTGVAISSLSGVAATNATLAFFGGGSLAAGGLGMAGGAWVLGGIVAAPALALFTQILADNAEKVKHDAKSYYESIKALAEVFRAEELSWEAIEKKTQEKILCLENFNKEFYETILKVEAISSTMGDEVSKWGQKAQNECKNMQELAQTIINIINAPLMNDKDELTSRIKAHQLKAKELIDEINAKWGEK